MKKLSLFIVSASILLAQNLLPSNFSQCKEISFFTKNSPPIPINDNMEIIKRYKCGTNTVYIGIEDKIPGILKLNINSNSKDFLLKHLKIQNFNSAVYIDKNLKKGVIAINLNGKKALKILFFNTDYKKILNYINSLNLKKIKEEL
jgi:hypothetical protein